MFRRILIPTDFSTASEWVFDDAVRIAGASNAEIVILHVRMTRASHPDELRFPIDPSIYEYAEQQELDRLRERVRRANATVATRLIVRQAPDPGTQICRTALDEGADLVVIATHARHHVSHLFVGATTVTVLAQPPAPVLAIRYGIRKRTALHRVVVPVHFKQTSRAALDLALRLNAAVELVMVCEEKDTSRAEEHLRSLAADGARVTTRVLQGSHAEKELVRHADKSDADAIFLNSTKEPTEGKLDIIRHASVPVMIVPE